MANWNPRRKKKPVFFQCNLHNTILFCFFSFHHFFQSSIPVSLKELPKELSVRVCVCLCLSFASKGNPSRNLFETQRKFQAPQMLVFSYSSTVTMSISFWPLNWLCWALAMVSFLLLVFLLAWFTAIRNITACPVPFLKTCRMQWNNVDLVITEGYGLTNRFNLPRRWFGAVYSICQTATILNSGFLFPFIYHWHPQS